MGVVTQSVRRIRIFATTIAIVAGTANLVANAQWPADDQRLGAANDGQPRIASIPQNAMDSSNCWASNSQQFPPLDCFRCGTESAYEWAPQNIGLPGGLSPAVAQRRNSPCALGQVPGYGHYPSGSCVPLANTANPWTGGLATGCLESGCVSQVPARRWYGGFEFLWLRAHFDQNVAMIIDPPIGNTLTPFDYNHDLTPRAWLGWQSACSGAGFRATYWRYDSIAAEERATAVPGASPVYLFVYGAGDNLSRNAYADLGETLVSNHRLMLHTLDLEGTQQFSVASLQCLAGVGVRLAEMDQHLRGEVYDASNALWEIVTNDLSFQSAGPTVSLQIQRRLGNSGFSVFNAIRGAFLFSDSRQGIYEMKDGFANEVTDVAEQTEILSMGELGLGIQYSRCIGTRAQFFVRGNYECQAWFDVGGPVDSHSTVAFSGIGLATGVLF